MAENNQKVIVTVEGKDETGKAFKSASNNAKIFTKDIDNVGSALKKIAVPLATFFGIQKIGQFFGESLAEFDESIKQATKLEFLLKKNTDATTENVNALIDQAQAMQKVGVISDDVIVALQAQLATFQLSSDTIAKMTPAITDMIVAEKGLNATTEDMISFGNAFGMAMEGNYASLTKRGFKIDDATKKIIELGSEEEKASAITNYLSETYGGLNEQMAQTGQGGAVNLKNRFSDFQKGLGSLISFIRLEAIDAFNELSESMDSPTQEEPWFSNAKWWAKTIDTFKFGMANLGDLMFEKVKPIFFGDEDKKANQIVEDFYNRILENEKEFEEKWAEAGKGIIETNSEESESIDELKEKYAELSEEQEQAQKIKDAFVSISKDIVKSFETQTTAISKLRKELDDLDSDTQKQLNTAEKRYQEDLKNKARDSQERIKQIEDEIEETRKARSAGWRDKIAELESEKTKEKAIIARIGGEVSDLNEEIAKDDLQLLKENYEAERAEIQSEAEKIRLEKEAEISGRAGVQLRGVIASLSPEVMNTLTAESQSFLGQIGAGANQYVFNFNGDVNDKDKLITVITEALNRQATLKGVAGK